LGDIALFSFLFTLAAKIVPIIPVSEVADAEQEMSEAIAKVQISPATTLIGLGEVVVENKKDDNEI
jgi:hypothetical protein